MAAKLTLQKKLASQVLKVGKTRVWIDPDKEKQKEVQQAITRVDIKRLVQKGVIKEKPSKVRMPKDPLKKKKRKGPGSRKGSAHSRLSKKRKWINTVRPLRALLKELREEDKIDNATYRKLYLLVKGGQFRNRSHMKLYIEQHRMLKKPNKAASAAKKD